MHVEIGADAAQFPEKEYKRNRLCSEGSTRNQFLQKPQKIRLIAMSL